MSGTKPGINTLLSSETTIEEKYKVKRQNGWEGKREIIFWKKGSI
jgi:hypothetical protein